MTYWKFKYSRTQRALAVGVSGTITNTVCDVFCSVDEGFLSEIISGPDYPYELSFDEQCLKIIDWIDKSLERSKNL